MQKSSRLKQLLKYVDDSKLGIEIAPYFNPAVSKADGYNVRILDVFDANTLREKAAVDPNIPATRIAAIEEVDIVGDASQIAKLCETAGLVGQVHFIVSSHNFEHLPNPIKFLQGVSKVLAPGGVLSMAIPECRAIFDYFRTQTRLVDWIEAFHNDLQQPSPAVIFDQTAYFADYIRLDDGRSDIVMGFGSDNPDGFKPAGGLRTAYADYIKARMDPGAYRDAHCSVVSNISFELMILELNHLGLLDLDILEISAPRGHEFMAHLIKRQNHQPIDDATFKARRNALLILNSKSLGHAGHPLPTLRNRVSQNLRLRLKAIFGKDLYNRVRHWNHQRLGKRPQD